MPIYEYRCENCAHELESMQKISEEPLKTCPKCGQNSLRKKVSRAAFRLKGGGWYETDFKSSADKKRNIGGEGDSGGSSGTSTETASTPSSTTSTTSSSGDKAGSSDAGGSKPSGGSDT
ncbi:MAG: zinc ribbon domain-containing protein [Pseudomonadales bacterium]|nr:zinc ribbon domain-containing protein [Pseudomonadales bacterium]MCP5184541.1 zinc ribbon domain-containing protein [Pseudomonadales bacterium]